MNHRQFEEWIFGDEPLFSEQQLELENHLRACPDCRQLHAAWHSAEEWLQDVVMVSPDRGFAARWQTKAEAEHISSRRRLSGLWSIFILLAVIGLILASISVFIWSYGGPTNAIVQTVETMTQFWKFLFASFRVSSVMVQLFPPLGLLLVWGLVGAIGILSSIWLMSYYQLTRSHLISQ